ncbi:MAG: hypothetical protein V4617_16620 [Gemmatimonadota bacterium]
MNADHRVPEGVREEVRERVRQRVRVRVQRRATAFAALVACATAFVSCADVGTGPTDIASIEFAPLDLPALVVGDTLRDANGAVARLGAIVRNAKGDVLTDVPVRFIYADYRRDSALAIDAETGLVRALRAAQPSNGEGRVIAQVPGELQIVRALVVTTRPDSIVRASTSMPLLNVSGADTATNRSDPLQVRVRHVEPGVPPALATVTEVNAWVVRFELVEPVNATNDTTALAWLVNDNSRPSVLDTTDASGTAGRRVRVRPQLLTTVDSTVVVVRATTTFRGAPVPGSPVDLRLSVRRAR